MKNKTLVRINLYIDYVNASSQMIENHATLEVLKETNQRIYFKERQYIDKSYLNKVRGGIECVKMDEGYKVICNLSVYCKPEEVSAYKTIIRTHLITESNKIKNKIEVFHRLYMHEELLEDNSFYISVTESSDVVV